MICQTDGRIVVGGLFTTFDTVNRSFIARLNLDGSLDGSFNPGSGADNPVYALAETFAGPGLPRKILIGGSFATVNGFPRAGIAQLNDDGTVDTSFAPAGVNSTNGTVYALAVYSTNDFNSGKILIGGDFTMINGLVRNHIARLNVDGSLDTSFDPGTGPNDSVRTIAIQVDGNVLIGGLFTSVGGASLSHIARLTPSGTVDAAFTPGPGANDVVDAIVLQEDQRIVVGGSFTLASGVTRNRLTRLNSDGTVDPAINFGLGADNFVSAIVIQADDKLVVAGAFTTFDGQSSPHIARVFGRTTAGQGYIEFTAANYPVNENAGSATITLRRIGGTGDPLTGNDSVQFFTTNGSAVAGTDYTGETNTVVFPVGETFQTVTVPITGNLLIQPNLTVNLGLQSAVGTSIAGQSASLLTILNVNSGMSFASPTFRVAKNAVNQAGVVSVVRTGSSIGAAAVDFATVGGGTAAPGMDYTPVAFTLNFVDGQTNALATVPILNNSMSTGDRTVNLALSNPSNTIVLAPGAAVMTIVDTNQGIGNVQFAQPGGYVVAETATNAVITVSRVSGSVGQLSVHWDASGGTATPGVDYIATNNILTFADGEISKTFSVPVLHNPLVTGNHTVNLTLSSPSGGALVTGPATVPLTITEQDVGFNFALASYFVQETAGTLVITVQRLGATNGTSVDGS